MSLARRHRDRTLASQIVASAPDGGADTTSAAGHEPAAGADKSTPADRATAEMTLRLTHDLRRLKDIKSTEEKIAAKRLMLPEYVAWVKGVIEADTGVGTGISADIVPTMMVWLIDIGNYDDALVLLPFLLRHNVQMPSRYNRDTATVALEEIADAALRCQAAGEAFPLDVLERVSLETSNIDMHDEARAKLMKATGAEYLRRAEDAEMTPEIGRTIAAALGSFRRAQSLNSRIGVKDRIKRAEKLLAVHATAFPPITETPEQGGDSAA